MINIYMTQIFHHIVNLFFLFQPTISPDRIPKIEALLLFGEPVRWETSLQLIVDILMTEGSLSGQPIANYPHITILACNMDLQCMTEAHRPR